MFVIEIAKLKIQIINKYSYLNKLCEDYMINSDVYDFSVSATDDEIKKIKDASTINHSIGYLESICIYQKICMEILKYDCIFIHACSVKINDYAHLFLAKSGTGKTTHCKLLKEYLGDKLSFINGDKPIIRKIDDSFYAFGTPWNGKERYGENSFAEIKSLVFIERDTTNSITRLDSKSILPKILNQIILPTDLDYVNKTFDLLNDLLLKANIYLLKCNTDITAAKCSYDAIIQSDS
ncbi:MAG: hypothetical protein J5691_01680 [Bacilli bacterium]|nr:hypothetical protein [Bacilli bacterium]